MDKRYGEEAIEGLGGGVVTEESRRSLQKAEDYCRRRKPKLAIPYLFKAIQDHNNLDAVIQMAFLSPTMQDCIEVLETAELRGREMLKLSLGQDCFDDESPVAGEFSLIIQTRPYMRVLQALVKCYFDVKDYNKSAETIIKMLRLSIGDSMGQRYWAGSVLIRCGRYADALYFTQQWLDIKTVEQGQPPLHGGVDFKPPHKNTMAVKKERRYTHTAGAILHSAALASFKHFGDCEQARQYLKLAVTANPNILLKILANVRKPDSLNNGPRMLNGAEDAQDYLWLTQDLWMESTVWNWANDNADVKKAVLKTCSRPTCETREVRVAEFKRCSACHLVSYCTPACQKEDWENHKPKCRERRYIKEATRAIQMGRAPPKDSPFSVFSADSSTGTVTHLG